MRRTIAIGLLCGGLAGCTLPSPFQSLVPGLGTAPGDLTADRQACNRTYPPRVGNYLPHAQCVNAAVERDAIPYARYADLVRLQEQLRVKYSALVDQGAISPREGERKMTEVDGLVDAAMRERDVGRGGVADHRIDRLDAMLQ